MRTDTLKFQNTFKTCADIEWKKHKFVVVHRQRCSKTLNSQARDQGFESCHTHCGQYYKLFTAVITPLAAYFSMILTELRR